MDVSAYLARIRYEGSREPTAETLRALQVAHLIAVPFENLDIPLGRPLHLGTEALFDKIVRRRRGGFCFELNGLFAALLGELGFHVDLLGARVAREDGQYGIPSGHMTLRVYAPGSPVAWLADVGFGDSFREPLRLESPAEQADTSIADGRRFRISPLGDEMLYEMRESDGPWLPRYCFPLEPRPMEHFSGPCDYMRTSPDSPFTRRRICSRATPDGRVTLSDLKLIVTSKGRRTETPIREEDYPVLLREHFGMELSGLAA
ncbi:MAG TPA: arylamine N-acetyltransferase [Terriglobales bacterium]|nr:arylamine N-acetyltransferase [Terriglobales bacterium]